VSREQDPVDFAIENNGARAKNNSFLAMISKEAQKAKPI